MKGELTQGRPLRKLVAFGFPLVVGTIAHSLFNLVDVWLVGRYAPETGPDGLPALPRDAALVAIHDSSVLNFLPMLVANGISVATIATVSRAVGARDGKRAAEVVNRSILVSILLGVVMGLVCGALAVPQIDFLKPAPEARETAVRCLQILSFGSVTMFTLLQVTAVERAAGRSIPPLIVLTGANITNAIAAVYAIPRWGAIGAAWATVLSRGLFAIVGLVWLYAKFGELRVWPGRFMDVIRDCIQLFRLGMPASLQIFSRLIAVYLITKFLSDGGENAQSQLESTEATAAYSVALRLEMIAMFACAGWGSAAAAAVGQCLGAGDTKRAIRMGWLAALVAGGSMILLGAAFYLFAPYLFPFFLSDDESVRLEAIVRHGTGYFRIVAFSYAFVGVGIVLAESINGAGATRFSFAVDFVAYVAVLSILALVMQHSMGRIGLWYALAIVHTAVALIYCALFGTVLRSRAVPPS
ncbi:MAG: MATE family efflux transporter [Planctomycetes bacterium]|nr:MATE family efflux transporter [Planctomycetota bacterium]